MWQFVVIFHVIFKKDDAAHVLTLRQLLFTWGNKTEAWSWQCPVDGRRTRTGEQGQTAHWCTGVKGMNYTNDIIVNVLYVAWWNVDYDRKWPANDGAVYFIGVENIRQF